jgi:Fic family protein
VPEPRHVVSLKALLAAGFSQTELARHLHVSHAAFNRWLHGKSEPRSRHIQAIQAFHQQNSFRMRLGTRVDVPGWEKKFAGLKGDWVAHFEQHHDLWEDLLLQMTYHTNRIEGSSLTLKETKTIIFDRKVFSSHSLTEHLEAINHRVTFLNLIPALQIKMNLGVVYAKMNNRTLMSGILDQAGQFRDRPIRIAGSRVVTCNHHKIADRMAELCTQMELAVNPISMIMQHAWFGQIHPFVDGNGRVARILLNFQFLRAGYPPIIIRSERKREYYQALEKAQLQEQYEPLIKLCFEELKETSKLD